MKQALTEVAAARLVERLLPGKCHHGYLVDLAHIECPVCHGSGQVWDEGIVEAVAFALWAEGIHDPTLARERWDDAKYPLDKRVFYRKARAVLSALVELLTEKVER